MTDIAAARPSPAEPHEPWCRKSVGWDDAGGGPDCNCRPSPAEPRACDDSTPHRPHNNCRGLTVSQPAEPPAGLDGLHHSPRCPAQWRCRFAVRGHANYDGSGYRSRAEPEADMAAHYEIYSGTAEQLHAVLRDPAALAAEVVGRIIDEHYRARREADPKGPPVHECGSYCGADFAARLAAVR